MPKGKGYTASQIQAMRDEGVLSPGEIENIMRNSAPTSDNSSRSGLLKGGLKGKALGAGGRGTGYKYFPDNP